LRRLSAALEVDIREINYYSLHRNMFVDTFYSILRYLVPVLLLESHLAFPIQEELPPMLSTLAQTVAY
jgi:hypothetical protein